MHVIAGLDREVQSSGPVCLIIIINFDRAGMCVHWVVMVFPNILRLHPQVPVGSLDSRNPHNRTSRTRIFELNLTGV